ncbi:hypothetical protein [Salinimonas chungwhensis]|uniref:hypothetical protein n=1 Tax=Salinimonas chungwhensis TaxID=265425 RepID=UPI00036B6975|nr:hypothetical protein [Salinimonas chungwhensis]
MTITIVFEKIKCEHPTHSKLESVVNKRRELLFCVIFEWKDWASLIKSAFGKEGEDSKDD